MPTRLNRTVQDNIKDSRKFRIHLLTNHYSSLIIENNNKADNVLRLSYETIKYAATALVTPLHQIFGSTPSNTDDTLYIEVSPHTLKLSVISQDREIRNLFYGCYIRIRYKKVTVCNYTMYQGSREKTKALNTAQIKEFLDTLYEVLPVINEISYITKDNIIFKENSDVIE